MIAMTMTKKKGSTGQLGGNRATPMNTTNPLQGVHMLATDSCTSAPERPNVDLARLAAAGRADAMGAALRAARAASPNVHVRPESLTMIEKLYKDACDEHDALFKHAAWCDQPDTDGSHSCVGGDPSYIDGVHGLFDSDPLPTVSAVAWARESDGLESVCLHLLADGDNDGAEGWFSASAARQLAAQLITAAELIEGGAR